MNVTIMYIIVALAICIVLLTLESSRNKNKLRDLELRFESTDRFIDRCHDKIAQLIHELQVLEGTQSKMADEIFKMNDLNQRLNNLERTRDIPLQPWQVPCNDPCVPCSNPHKDCINCPRQYNCSGNTTITDSWSISNEGLQKNE